MNTNAKDAISSATPAPAPATDSKANAEDVTKIRARLQGHFSSTLQYVVPYTGRKGRHPAEIFCTTYPVNHSDPKHKNLGAIFEAIGAKKDVDFVSEISTFGEFQILIKNEATRIAFEQYVMRNLKDSLGERMDALLAPFKSRMGNDPLGLHGAPTGPLIIAMHASKASAGATSAAPAAAPAPTAAAPASEAASPAAAPAAPKPPTG